MIRWKRCKKVHQHPTLMTLDRSISTLSTIKDLRVSFSRKLCNSIHSRKARKLASFLQEINTQLRTKIPNWKIRSGVVLQLKLWKEKMITPSSFQTSTLKITLQRFSCSSHPDPKSKFGMRELPKSKSKKMQIWQRVWWSSITRNQLSQTLNSCSRKILRGILM